MYYGACEYGDVDAVKSALKKIRKNAPQKYLMHLNQGLCTAANHGHESIVSLLIDKGADVNYQLRDEDGKLFHTVLMAAIIGNHVGVVSLLLERGADVTLKTADGADALNIVAINDRAQMVDMLIKHGAYVDQTDPLGFTSLMIALGKGHVETAQKLVDNGADLKKKNSAGSNALIVSAFSNKLESVRFVLNQPDYGDINMTITYKNVARCEKSCSLRNTDFLFELNGKRIEIDFNALGYAQAHRNSEMISLLKERGAKSKPKEEKVHTLVHHIDIKAGLVHFNDHDFSPPPLPR